MTSPTITRDVTTGARLRLGAGGAVMVFALLCTVGGIGAFGPGTSETEHIGSTENAATATVGAIRIEDAYVLTTGGGSASLRFTLVDQGTTPDRLKSVGITERSTPTGAAAFRPLVLTPGQMIDLDTSGEGTPLPAGSRVEPGTDVTVHFQFARAGGVSLPAPVVASSFGGAGSTAARS